MRTAIADELFALNINYIRCAFGPGSIASRGLLFGAETVSRNCHSERDALSGSVLNRKLYPGTRLQNGIHFSERSTCGGVPPLFVLRLSNYVIASHIIGRYNIASYNVKEGWTYVYRKNSGNV